MSVCFVNLYYYCTRKARLKIHDLVRGVSVVLLSITVAIVYFSGSTTLPMVLCVQEVVTHLI